MRLSGHVESVRLGPADSMRLCNLTMSVSWSFRHLMVDFQSVNFAHVCCVS